MASRTGRPTLSVEAVGRALLPETLFLGNFVFRDSGRLKRTMAFKRTKRDDAARGKKAFSVLMMMLWNQYFLETTRACEISLRDQLPNLLMSAWQASEGPAATVRAVMSVLLPSSSWLYWGLVRPSAE